MVDSAPIPPPLKSAWAEIVRQQPKSKEVLGKESGIRSTAAVENSKQASQCQEPRQAPRSENTPSIAKVAVSEAPNVQRQSSEIAGRSSGRTGSGTSPSTNNAANNGGRSPAQVKAVPPILLPATSAAPSAASTANDTASVEKGVEDAQAQITDEKCTPRKEVICTS